MFFRRFSSSESESKVASVSGIKSPTAGKFFLRVPTALSPVYSELIAPTPTLAPAAAPVLPSHCTDFRLPIPAPTLA